MTTEYNHIPNEWVEAYYEAADLVVLPYKRIYQSGVLLLSMSYGRPVLTSDLPAFMEIIEHGENGFLFESENAEDLADKIMDLAENKGQLSIVRDRASKKIRSEFDWVHIGAKTKALYSTLTTAE